MPEPFKRENPRERRWRTVRLRRKMKPNLELYNHLEEGRLNSSVTDALIGALESCLPSVLALPEGPVPVLSGLDEVEISVVSDDVIRDVHARF